MGRQLNMSGILDVLWWCLLEVSSSTLPWTLMSWGTVIPQVILPEINSADSQRVIPLCVCVFSTRTSDLTQELRFFLCVCGEGGLVLLEISFFTFFLKKKKKNYAALHYVSVLIQSWDSLFLLFFPLQSSNEKFEERWEVSPAIVLKQGCNSVIFYQKNRERNAALNL